MFARPVRFWVVAGALLAINVGGWVWVHSARARRGGPAALCVEAVLPAGEADDADRVTLVFSDAAVGEDAVGRRLERAPFAIDPQPEGYWQWAGPRKLEFVLASRLPPGRVFKVRAASRRDADALPPLVGRREFELVTRPLRLVHCALFAADREQATIELRFNQPVDPARLGDKLLISDAKSNAPLEPAVLTRQPADVLTVRVHRPEGDKLRVRLAEDLAGSGAQRALGTPQVREVAVAAAFVLLDARPETPALEGPVRVGLHFSKGLDREQSVPAVEVSPAVTDLRVSFESVWNSISNTREGSLVLTGAFVPGQRYTATVGPTVLAASGETLGQKENATFDIPEHSAGLRFPFAHGVLSPRGNLALDLEVVNLSGVKLTAYRVYANNLAAHLREPYAGFTARQVTEKTVKLDLPRNQPRKVAVDLQGLLAAPLGVYRVEAHALDQRWMDTSAMLSISDLGLTVKREKAGVLVWVASLATGAPVAGARVSVLSETNQKLADGDTAADGTVHLAAPDQGRDGAPWLITAEVNGDLNFLRLDGRSWALEDADITGRPYPNGYEVMLYPDRGVYRPGETIHLAGIIRDPAGAAPPPFPLTIAVHRPDGKVAAELLVKPDDTRQGVFDAAYTPAEDAYTGPYAFRVSLPGAGATQVLGQAACLVEAYVPARIELKATATQERYGPDDALAVRADARYLFGQPAAELPVRLTGVVTPATHRSARYPGFVFTSAQAPRRLVLPAATQPQKLDAHGHAELKVEAPANLEPGLWKAGLTVEVTEPGGRTVSASVPVLIDKADRYVGVRLAQGDTVVANQPAKLEWVRVSGADEAVATAAEAVEFRLSRVEYDNVLEEVSHRMVWKSVERLVPIAGGVQDVQPPAGVAGDRAAPTPGRATLTCPEPGAYRLDVIDRGTRSATRLSFYAWHAGQSEQTLDLSRPERLQIVLDQPMYATGSTAKIAVRSPFAGTLLLTLESDKVVAQRVVAMTGNTVEVELPVPAGLRGGAFVAATVVRAIDPARTDWLPHRALGVARLVIDHRPAHLPVTITAAEQANPGASPGANPGANPGASDKLAVTVQTAPPLDPQAPPAIHLWAVDEGILLTTSYVTPKPTGFFFAPRELAVSSLDLFADLLPDQRRPVGMVRIGGDGGDEDDDAPRVRGLPLRRSSLPMRQKAPAVIWQTWQRAASDGTLHCELPLPKAHTRLRLMAVAVDGDRYGSAQRFVTLATPLLVEASWPRFAAPGDRFQVPIKLFNTTAQALQAKVTLEAHGPMELDRAALAAPVDLAPGQTATRWLSAKATGVGNVEAVVRASASASGAGAGMGASSDAALNAEDDATLTIRAGALPEARAQVLAIKAGQPLTINPDSDFLPPGATVKLSVGGRPGVQLRPALERLLDYPYGCVEQTTSRLFGLLYARDILALDSGDEATALRGRVITQMVDAGISRLWSMQTPSGGLSYWPGGHQPDLWGSCYAASWLLQAKQAGYRINARFLDDLTKYLHARLNESSSRRGEEPDANMRALLCHALAAFGKPPLGWMARLAEQPERLDLEGRAHLAGAFFEAGQSARGLALCTDPMLNLTLPTTTGGRLVSQTGGEAALLSVLLDLDKAHPWIPVLAQRLDTARKNGAWGSTYSNAAALAALAKYQLRALPAGEFKGTLGFAGGTRDFDHTKPLSATFADLGKPITLATQGTGMVYVAVVREGLLKPELLQPYDHQLEVRRRWLDRAGQPVDPLALQVGDLVHVEVTLLAPGRRERVRNLVIVDCLPGGMEVENPRLATSARADDGTRVDDGARAAATPDFVQFLDDRVLIFADADGTQRQFAYDLRVITAGEFAEPPIQASCMYDPTIASVHGGGKVVVSKDAGPRKAPATQPADRQMTQR